MVGRCAMGRIRVPILAREFFQVRIEKTRWQWIRVALALALCLVTPAYGAEPIRLAMIEAFSGPFANTG